jgi:hypothetical protein
LKHVETTKPCGVQKEPPESVFQKLRKNREQEPGTTAPFGKGDECICNFQPLGRRLGPVAWCVSLLPGDGNKHGQNSLIVDHALREINEFNEK